MELKFLGRGSAFNVKEGNTSAYIKQDDMLLLIDCGESIFQRILEKNLLDGVKEVNILITHFHSDHAGSLSSLIMYCFYCKGIKPNIAYFNEEDITNYLESTGAIKGALWNFKWLRDLDYLNMDIDVIGTNHVKELISGSYAFCVNGKEIFYSGDTIGDNLSDDIANYYDEIYHDTCLADYDGNVHTSLRKLCELISPEYRHKIYCMHLDCNELLEKAKLEGFNVVEVE
jgi:ribonuclease BN (tRNA processing enzyme)